MVSTTEMFERKFYKKSTGPHQKLARKHRRIKVAAIARVQLKNLVILLLLKRRIERKPGKGVSDRLINTIFQIVSNGTTNTQVSAFLDWALYKKSRNKNAQTCQFQ